MSANDATKVSVGKANKTGAAFSAAAGTAIPTDATSALPQAFVNHGYVGADGLTNTTERESTDVKAWGGDVVLTPQTSFKETYKLKLIQSLDADTLKAVYGDANVSGSGSAIAVEHGPVELPRKAWVFEVLLTGGKIKRICIPDGQITEVGDVIYKDDTEIGYEVTITAFPDAEGVTSYEYIANAA